MTQRLRLTALAAAIAGLSTLAVGAQPAPDIGNSSPIILAQQTPPGFQTEGAAGQTTPPSKADAAPKTPTLRQQEQAMKAKCDAMSAGPQKDACMKEYRAYVGGVTQGTPPPAEFRTEGQAGGMGKAGGAPKTPPPSGPAVSTPPAFQSEGAAGQTTPPASKK